MTEKYDSREDTERHILRVGELLWMIRGELVGRAVTHDSSKLQDPEKEVFDRVTPLLKGMTYGSDEYKASLAEMGPALDHHYEKNRHHPEYHTSGIHGMDLVDLVEMFCDWCAATERHADGDIHKSINHNQGRFHFSDDLASIFTNTANRYGMGKNSKL